MSSYFNLNSSRCTGIQDVIRSDDTQNIKKKCKRKYKLQIKVIFQSSLTLQPTPSASKITKQVAKFASMPNLIKTDKYISSKKFKTISKCGAFQLKNLKSQYDNHRITKFFNFAPKPIKWKVYRCQLSTTRENCCCSCNSDAMFEVMKGLYDCYKMKNCNRCNCVLCGHLPRDERLVGEIVKSLAAVGLDTSSARRRKEQTQQAEKDMEGKPLAEKEKILRNLAAYGAPLPKGKTPSEKSLIRKVRRDLGLPPEPTTPSIKSRMREAAKAGLLTPLDGKTNAQKEKILEGFHNMGIPLPEGRTPSEKSLIDKVAKKPRKSIFLTPSEKKRKAKGVSLIQPLDGKPAKEKEKILRSLARQGLPFPKGKTESEKKIINKYRTDLGLPPEPKTQAMRDKHAKAADAGLLQPLEGKTPKEKENILRGLHNMEIPLPEGRTPSEKSLIAKIAAEPLKTLVLSPSDRIRRAKAAGLITPLQGKTPEEKEKIIKGLAEQGISLPEGKTSSEKKLINKVRADLGLPPEPNDSVMRHKHAKAADAGLMEPLEGKSPRDKKRILQGLHNAGIPLPEGRTPSEKALIAKIETEPSAPSIRPTEKIRQAKAAGLLTPLHGKTPEQKENIFKGLAKHDLPLPEANTASEKKLLDKVRANLGLPPEPKTQAMRDKYAKAADAGLLQPLDGKTPTEKKYILRGLHNVGIPLPEGRTPSEKAVIAMIAEEPQTLVELKPSKTRKARDAGFLTPLQGKSPEQKEKILKGLANLGVPLPAGKSKSEKNLINKIRADLGLPPEPEMPTMRDKHAKAANAGFLQPLEGKTPKEKKKILRGLHNMGIPLPKGRTPSEKSLIAKIGKAPREPSILPSSEKIRRAKAAGLLIPLEGKSPEQKEKILRNLANLGIPLPEGKTNSDIKLLEKVRGDLGLPPEPKTPAVRDKHTKAADAGFLKPLEGKSPEEKKNILRGLHNIGIPLPNGRTPSEKSLIAKIGKEPRQPLIIAPSEKMRSAKAAGLLTPLQGKSSKEKEKILRGLANLGIALPEGKTKSDIKLLDKVRGDLGLPPEPKTPAMRDKHTKAADAGFLKPLEGKSPEEKINILRGLHNMGIPLPEGRTPSEKSLIAKIGNEPRQSSIIAPSEKFRRAQAAGLITPWQGKSPSQQEKILRGLANLGLPFPEGKTVSENKLLDKVRGDLGLPPEPKTPAMRDKYAKAADAGFLKPLEGKSPEEKKNILRGLHNIGIPLPIGRTPSEKSLIAKILKEHRKPTILEPAEKIRRAKAAGLLTPLEGKSHEQKEKILRGLADLGIPLPEGKTKSDIKLLDKVRDSLGLPPEPKTPEMKYKQAKAADAGFLKPLEGKSPEEKRNILSGLHNMGIPLPIGRTPSEKSLIAKISKEPREPSILSSSEKIRKAKAAGLLTPLEGKSPEQKEKILRGLANLGIPLPERKTKSDFKLLDKVRGDLGLPPEPKTPTIRDKHTKAADAGFLKPLEGKSPEEKKNILRGLHNMGIPLPVGRTSSEKSLIAKISKEPREASASEKIRRAKAAGLLTPLEGKSPEQKEKILRGLANLGIPLPEGKTKSDIKLLDKVRDSLGLPPEPKTPAIRDKHAKAADAGILKPLEGKSPEEKKNILMGLHNMGIPLPVGRTPSEKSLIAKIGKEPREPSKLSSSEKIRKAKAAGLLTPLEGKSPKQKEKILRGLANLGIPLPEGKTKSDIKLLEKVRGDLGLPPEPKTPAIRDKHAKAADAGILKPLEGKLPEEKKNILMGLHNMGIPLPVGRTPSEKSLIAKIGKEPREPSPSEKIRRAKAAGLLTPLQGKSAEQKEKILRGLANLGIPLPEGKTKSDIKLLDKVRGDLGLPQEPKTPAMRDKHTKAADAGFLKPLEGKSPEEKKNILRGLHNMGITLPIGRSPSEKSLIAKITKEPHEPSIFSPSEKMRKAKAAGLLTPWQGKSPEEKEKILRGLADLGLPLPEGKTKSDNTLLDKVRGDLGLPPEPKTPAMRDKLERAAVAGFLKPLEGKSPEEKKNILRGLHNMRIPLPEGRTQSEKSLIAKIGKEPHEPPILSPSDKIRRAKAAGLLSPFRGKSPEQREKILKGLTDLGLPLPEGKTASEKKLLEKVRADLGLPPEPKNSAMREKYAKATDAGFLQPLEGKTPKEKTRILRGLHNMGIPLPEGRTPSEKGLVDKIAAEPRAHSLLAPSEKIRKAKAAGLLTPLQGKPPDQKDKILRGLAMHGLPLPEGKSASEKKLINNVRVDLGLPPEPETPIMRENYAKAADAGLLQPLEGKSPKDKKKILRGLHNMGILLPEGRTPSEKSLIARITTEPSKLSLLAPSEKLRKAIAAGLVTPLEGKLPEEKEKILKGLAEHGLPLPEGKTASERKLLDKVRAELGLPPEPKTQAMRDKYAKAADAGLLFPLEGKPPKEKEKLLKGLAERDIPLPEGRTSSEKALISKVKAAKEVRKKLDEKTAKIMTEGKGPADECICDQLTPVSEKVPRPSITTARIQKARKEGLFTPLHGKSPEEKEKILKELAAAGLPLPEGKSSSEKSLIKQIKDQLGISEEPPAKKIRKARADGFLTPLESKTPDEKEKILRGRVAAGLPLPKGRTPSEKDLIKKIKDSTGYVSPSQSERLRKAEAAGLLTPLEEKTPSRKEKILKDMIAAGLPLQEGKTPSEKQLIKKLKESELPRGLLTPLTGKTPEQKKQILNGLLQSGIPLPEGKTPSETKIIAKVRAEAGLPPEPKTPSLKEKYKNAEAAGIITPLEGKMPAQKEKILKKLHEAGIPLPEGRSPSEKAMIKKIKAGLPKHTTLPQRIKAAKAAGLLTPLEGKTPKEKEKILKGLLKAGVPLPKGTTPSEKKLINTMRVKAGLPPEPKTPSLRQKYNKALAEGFITPLEGKTPQEKENILKNLHDTGIPLPEGRTPSEKVIIKKIKAELPKPSTLSQRLKTAKAAGLLTPLEGKTPKEKKKVLHGLAKVGAPLPEGTTPSEKEMIKNIRAEAGLPPEPKTPSMKEKYAKALTDGIITPLEGKTPAEKANILRKLLDSEIPLPEGRTPSEKAMIKKAKAGLLKPPPLEGKTPKEKKTILKDMLLAGIPLPEGTTPSEKELIDEVRKETGMPPSPKTPSLKEKYQKAEAKGIITPLEGKTPAKKENILRKLQESGIPLPEGRTPSEKAMIKKVKAGLRKVPTPSQRLKAAKAAGLLTPLEGKTPSQKEKILKGLAQAGVPLPEGKTPSEKKLIKKIRAETGLPPEPKTPFMKDKYNKALADGIITPLEGKIPEEKEKVIRKLLESGIPLPEGRTPSEKDLIKKVKAEPKLRSPSQRLKVAKAAGLLTPLEGKTPDQKEKILRGLAQSGLPLPQGKTPSEKKLINQIRTETGLPPEPKTPSMKDKYTKALAEGIITPLEGKTPEEKGKVLRNLLDTGIPLPEGRTPSEKALIRKIKAEPKLRSPSQRLKAAKAAGLLTPLEGKTPDQKKKILTGLVQSGVPLPEGKTPSEKKLINKIRAETGLPPEPKTPSMKDKYNKALADGIITPLEGKTPEEKEKVLRKLLDTGIPLPEGRTPSEKALIKKVKSEPKPRTPSQRLKDAKAAGLLTPLEGKTPDQKEKILRGLAQSGVPLPEGKTLSERKLINQIRTETGLPPEPKTPSMKDKYTKALAEGIITPLEGKTPEEKGKVLRNLLDTGIPLPEGRTPSEKALIRKIKAEPKLRSPSQRLKAAKAAGLLTPLEGKTPDQKKKILTGLVQSGVPLPEGKTPSEKKLINKIRAETGLPPEPKTPSMKDKYNKALADGIITPLEGKTPEEKEKVLRKLLDTGIPLPEGRTPSEKALIKKVKSEPKPRTPSQRLKDAKAAGLLTPLEGKTPDQKEKILRGLAQSGVPLPEGKTLSERKLINKIRAETGLPPEPKTSSMKDKYNKALADGIITPLEGKTPEEKEKVLRKLLDTGIPLPEGRTPSEKALVRKIKAEPKLRSPSQRLKAAKAAGLLTPLEGKTPDQKEKILRGLAKSGVPLPESKTPSEKNLINKIRAETGLPPEPKTPSMKDKYNKALAEGIITPLEGKTPEEKGKILRKLLDTGIPLPEGRTPSEKGLIKKIKAEPKPRSPSQRLKAAKAAGLLTPLEGKTPEDKEEILKGLVKARLPLPEGKTLSENKMIDKIRAETGLPPEPKTPSFKKKYKHAQADGLITPLEGKSPEEKEHILRKLQEVGIPLPEGRTSSEKALIKKIESEIHKPTLSHRKKAAKAAGLITPLKGKTSDEKERILRGLIDARLPLPKGKTKSEKSLIRKLRDEAELPRKTKTVAVGEEAKKMYSKAGIVEDIEEIKKTTVCDQACGCDKKKIRFKHSYVKIRVTSPDISSFCPCPEECIPGVKNGVFVDNGGIKVTIGSVVSIPSYFRISTESLAPYPKEFKNDKLTLLSNCTDSAINLQMQKSYNSQNNIFEIFPRKDKLNYILATSRVYNSSSSENSSQSDKTFEILKRSNSEKNLRPSRYFTTANAIFRTPLLKCANNYMLTKNVPDTSGSIIILKSETSLSFTSSCECTDSSSIISITDDSESSNTASNLTSISDVLINVECLADRDKRLYNYHDVHMS